MSRLRFFLITSLLLASVAARADVTQLRFVMLAPDGTSWARDAKTWVRDVETASNGKLAVKLYFGGIADDIAVEKLMQKDQLDGALSGGILCQNISPSLRVMRIPGLVQDRGEGNLVLTRLYPTLQAEARQRGFQLLGVTWLGRDVVLSRAPVDSMAALAKLRLWEWNLEPALIAYSRAMGLDIVPQPIGEAADAYDDGKLDGFVAIPSAILGFQWYAKRMFLSRVPFAPVIACLAMSTAAFDRLPPDLRDVVADATGKSALRYAETARWQDDQLLGGLFQKQGITITPVSPIFRAEFLEAARAAREKLAGSIVSTELLLKVQALLADYRNLHR